MKLLLTSAGITNDSIAAAFLDLAALPKDQIKLLFVPTAANVERGDKGWLVNNFTECRKRACGEIDILDIAAVPESVWRPRFEWADAVCFGGGNEQYLAKVLRETGVGAALPELLQNKVYVGISAGSMVAGKFPSAQILKIVYPEEDFITDKIEGALNLVPLNFLPHLNSSWFPHVRKDIVESLTGVEAPLYALDDASALKIDDDNIEIVSEGDYYVKQNNAYIG